MIAPVEDGYGMGERCPDLVKDAVGKGTCFQMDGVVGDLDDVDLLSWRLFAGGGESERVNRIDDISLSL